MIENRIPNYHMRHCCSKPCGYLVMDSLFLAGHVTVSLFEYGYLPKFQLVPCYLLMLRFLLLIVLSLMFNHWKYSLRIYVFRIVFELVGNAPSMLIPYFYSNSDRNQLLRLLSYSGMMFVIDLLSYIFIVKQAANVVEELKNQKEKVKKARE